jgi:hypothetical protein
VIELAGFTDAEIVAESWRRGDLSYKLHAAQRKLDEAWRASDAITTVLHAARGFGKTTWELIKGAERCLQRFPVLGVDRPARVVLALPTREQAKLIALPVFGIVCEDAPKAYKPVWVASDHCFYFPSTEARLFVDGADDERGNHLRGPHIDLLLGDEAGFWRHLAYVYRSVLLPQLERVGGRAIIASSSPESVGHDFVGLIGDAITRGGYHKLTIDDNPRVTAAQRASIVKESGGEQSTHFRREYMCEIVTEAEKAVVPEFDQTRHVVSEVKHPRFYDAYGSIDLGMTDYTHWLGMHYDFERATLVVEDEICKNYTPVSELAPLIYEKEHELWKKRPHRRVSDNHPMEIAEFHRQSTLQPDLVRWPLIFEPADNRDPEIAINRMRVLFKQGKIEIHERCKQLIHQLRVGVWNERRTDFERIPGIGHLDGVMALAYAVLAVDYNKNPVPWNADHTPGETWVSPDVKRRVQQTGLQSIAPDAKKWL